MAGPAPTGIYALEQLAIDSYRDQDQATIVEVLSAFIRLHSDPSGQWNSSLPSTAPLSQSPAEQQAALDADVPHLARPSVDVQAAVTVLGRLPDKGGSRGDLTGAYLPYADLYEAKLTFAKLAGIDLIGARLALAELVGADLNDADLTDANLFVTDLTGADLTDADLTRATLIRAKLTASDLTDANLTGAILTEAADLTDADLTRADLTGADLSDADLTRTKLINADLTDANLTRADQHGEEDRQVLKGQCCIGWEQTDSDEVGAGIRWRGEFGEGRR
jgi:Pentapeptide repeats (8 copies)